MGVDQSNKDDSLCAAPVDLSGDPLGGGFLCARPRRPSAPKRLCSARDRPSRLGPAPRGNTGTPHDGFAKFFASQSEEERGHAEQFMQYQNIRGGKVVLKPLAVPDMQFSRVDGTSDALYAFELALMLEKFVYRKLLDLHALGADCEDPQFCDEIEKHLGEQVRAIKEMASYVAQIKRLGTGHGVWDLD